ncbi:MAG: hypothetical protein GYA57_15515 [Myxococcales bacterium]|nr:hypothetical protein [Myxococcales bacterium]
MKDAQVGFNTNVAYRGVTLHIQTEDSGLGRPHVITHLYREGTILATRRTSYDPAGEPAEVRARVRALMKSQHKQVILDLRNGVFDETINRVLAGAGPATGGEEPAAAAPPAEEVAAPPAEPEVSAAAAPAAAAAGNEPEAGAAEVVRPARATPAAGRGRSSYRPPEPGPTAPDRVLPEGTGSIAVGRPRRPAPLRPVVQREREGFGKDLISDRSLDEVVLSYLAEELTKDEK